MAAEQRLQALEDENRIIKGEVKKTLESVRDFLLDLNLPAIEEAATPEVHEREEHHEGERPDTRTPPGDPSNQPPQGEQDPASSRPPAEEQAVPSFSQVTTVGPMPPQATPVNVPGQPTSQLQLPARDDSLIESSDDEMSLSDGEDELLDIEDENEFEEAEQVPGSVSPFRNEGSDDEDLPPLEPQGQRTRIGQDTAEKPRQHTSQVNLLTNLIRWVSRAENEIGYERLPAFLDVYCIGEPLSPETREVILYLAERIAPELENSTSPDGMTDAPRSRPLIDAETWSQLILELQGILSYGRASFQPQQLWWKSPAQHETDTEKGKEKAMAPEAVTPKVEEEEAAAGENEQYPAGAASGLVGGRETGVIKGKKAGLKKKKRTGKSLPDRRAVRLKLILPVDGGHEEEFSIGEFSLNMTPGNGYMET